MNIKFKLSIIAMSLVMTNFISADYMAKIPLEVSNGGNLPNNSIIIGNNTGGGSGPIIPNEGAEGETEETPLLPHNPEDCIENEDSYYEIDEDGNKYVSYNGQEIHFPVSKGDLVYSHPEGYYNTYKVCYTEPAVGTDYVVVDVQENIPDMCEDSFYLTSEVEALAIESVTQLTRDPADPDYDLVDEDELFYTDTRLGGSINEYCTEIKEVTYKLIQNTKTLVVDEHEQEKEVLKNVAPYIFYEGRHDAYCYYQTYNDFYGNGEYWKTLDNINLSYFRGGNLQISRTASDRIYDSTILPNGGGFYAMGRHMETIGGVNYHAACQFGGW